SGGSTETGRPATQCGPAGPRIVGAEVEQEFASRVEKGQIALIHDDSSSGPTWRGRVVRLSDWYTHRRSMLQEPLQFNDVRTMECIVQLDAGQAEPRIGQRVRGTLGAAAASKEGPGYDRRGFVSGFGHPASALASRWVEFSTKPNGPVGTGLEQKSFKLYDHRPGLCFSRTLLSWRPPGRVRVFPDRRSDDDVGIARDRLYGRPDVRFPRALGPSPPGDHGLRRRAFLSQGRRHRRANS